ncbi:3-dehydroquinate dehydratase [Amycolatopsis orientalis]|uniref:3-dehydroquinate dehydratase n=1 Tax=Amycolatopsis orientalis TaxID=31958 RepID=A0A193BY92_AMYOR|nr:type II 3-dehydroquinate dehydratase [Amycolatopsis orientalis]ANN17140.1 3-dehydroquinate dehydratase [Amycolatopsis orientalis]
MPDNVDLLLLNGPNLGALGTRKPEVYGRTTLAEITATVRETVAEAGYGLRCVQSDTEGELVRAVHENADCFGAIVNPGALMMAGWSLRDALECFPAPWIEVHISNLWAREPFRHNSILSALSSGVISGLGADGYRIAAIALLHRISLPAGVS